MAVRQEVNNFESSVVVQELEFAMNLALFITDRSKAVVLMWSLLDVLVSEFR